MRSTIAALLLVGGLLAGCSSSSEPRHDRTTSQYHHDPDLDRNREHMDTPVSRASEREDWNSIQHDPVCGYPVNPKSALKEYFNGKIYYFDNKDCWQRFHDNPQAYFPTYDDRRYPDDRRPRDVK